MKNVKVILTGIAMVAVVGGVFAFKAKNYGAFYLYQKDATNTCHLQPGTFIIGSTPKVNATLTTFDTPPETIEITNCDGNTAVSPE